MRRVTRLAVGVLSLYLVRQVKDQSPKQARPGFLVTQLTSLLRQSVLKSFGKLNLLSPEAAETMLSWPIERRGFNVHVDTRVDEDERAKIKTLLRYLTRPPVALERLSYIENSGQVRYRTRKGAELHYLRADRLLGGLDAEGVQKGSCDLSQLQSVVDNSSTVRIRPRSIKRDRTG